MKNWHTMKVEELTQELDVNLGTGLSAEEAARRLEKYGPNELVERGAKSPWKILWEQLTGIMVVILIVSAVISLLLHEYTDAITILIIVVLNALLGFTQEYRAEQAMAALKKMATPRVRVRRGGHVAEVAAQELVPGDVILLEAGNAIPADCRLVEEANLRVQEAVLTGESEPVEKFSRALEKPDLAVADRRNMLYMGTVATYGRGSAVVAATGMQTELGHIADMIQNTGSEPTPLQRRLEQLGKGLAVAALGIVALVFVLGLLRGEDIRLLIMTAISMSVAAVPEGLPAVVTIALALGAQRMLKRQALIRKLPAVETLGSVTTICSDKTGTLTENRMTVTILDVAGNRLNFFEQVREYSPQVCPKEEPDLEFSYYPSVPLLLLSGTLCNDAILECNQEKNVYTAVGDPTEGALVIAAAHANLWKDELEEIFPRTGEVPFDSDRKRMTTIHRLPGKGQALPHNLSSMLEQGQGQYVAFTKGAVDGLLQISDQVWVEDHIEPLTREWAERIQDANNAMAQKGMRVLGVALRWLDENPAAPTEQSVEYGLVFVGMSGMIDPARPEVKDAVAVTRSAGVRPVMITGDHPLTALHIAQELGIATNDQVLTGQELAKMSVDELKAVVEDLSVYARVSPEHKLKIVQALQEKGHIVAMTGDGVNDAPALKRADIGVAMGITGTDVSKEAADMVLLDDNYATIVAAVEEGRRIYDNIRKFIRYTMTSNAGEIWVMLLAPFLGMPLALLPLQILWVNLVTDGLPGLALTVEPAERDTMQRPPHSPKENIFGRGMGRDILVVGLIMGLISLGVGYFAWLRGDPAWQTMAFTTLTMAQMGNALAVRSERYSLWQIGLFSNRLILGAVLLTFALQMMVVYVPFFQNIFSTMPLTIIDLVISLGCAVLVYFSIEVYKIIVNRR
ncbi:MAG TPA: cation-translocating P-type ATPase [Anaerolineales bacterium]|nr:cation-translocating P-type ATPase [Anaerolineales bacterium]